MEYEVVVLGFGVSCLTAYAYLSRELSGKVSKIVLMGKMEELNNMQIAKMVIEKVRNNLGESKVIVIYDLFIAMLVKDALASNFPMQKFAYPSIELIKMPSESPEITLRLKKLFIYQEARIKYSLAEYKWRDRSKRGTWAEKCILDGVRAVLGDQGKLKV